MSPPFCMRYLYSILIMGCLLFQSAHASTIQYGDLIGATVFFNGVNETSSSIPAPFPNLYGIPDIWMADMMSTGIQLFQAQQQSVSGSKTVASTLSVSLVAKPGFLITGIIVEEYGEYAISGGTGSVSVSANGSLTSLGPTINNNGFHSDASTSSSGLAFSNWSLSIPFNLSPSNYGTAANFSISNTLNATSNSAVDSYLKKNGFKINVLTVPILGSAVPEPSSAAIVFVLCVTGRLVHRRRPLSLPLVR